MVPRNLLGKERQLMKTASFALRVAVLGLFSLFFVQNGVGTAVLAGAGGSCSAPCAPGAPRGWLWGADEATETVPVLSQLQTALGTAAG